MRKYQENAASGHEPPDFLEQDWHADVKSVARRLNLLRSVYKAIQTLKRKPHAEKGVPAGLDIQSSIAGSPMGLDDEHSPAPPPLASRLGLHDDDDFSSGQDAVLPSQATRSSRRRVLPS